MSPTAVIVLIVGAVGHIILWAALVNRAHAFGIQRRWVNLLTVICGIFMVAVPLFAAAAFTEIFPSRSAPSAKLVTASLWTYIALCAGLFLVAIVQRWHWYGHPERRGALGENHTSIVTDVEKDEPLTAPGIPRLLSYLPYNEVLKLSVQEKQIAIPRLTHTREPVRIAHISDLHMSGRIKRGFFERVVDEVNACEPDIIAITGDIVEFEKCLDWIPATIGRLRAQHGVYYVLGNHDRHVSILRLKTALADAGMVYLGSGACHPLTVRGVPLLLAGNELPWFKPATEFRDCPAHDSRGLPLRIVLAHSPDQFDWAQTHDVDLMLAGHLHGGQVRLPLLGAILAPSRFGVRYSAGVFTAGKTVMHVSRGTGSLTPIRYNCPPEIAVLALNEARTSG